MYAQPMSVYMQLTQSHSNVLIKQLPGWYHSMHCLAAAQVDRLNGSQRWLSWPKLIAVHTMNRRRSCELPTSSELPGFPLLTLPLLFSWLVINIYQPFLSISHHHSWSRLPCAAASMAPSSWNCSCWTSVSASGVAAASSCGLAASGSGASSGGASTSSSGFFFRFLGGLPLGMVSNNHYQGL